MFTELVSHGSGDRPRSYRTGWELLLPSVAGLSLACFDPGGLFALDLAQVAGWVEVLLTDRLSAEGLLHKAREAGLDNVSARVIGEGEVPVAPAWDGLVLHDPAGGAGVAAVIGSLMPMLQRHARENAFVYWSAPNPLAMGNAQRAGGLTRWQAPGAGGVMRRMAEAGLRGGVAWPLLLGSGGRVAEVIPPAGYGQYRNPGKWRERLKRFFWNRQLSRWFAHASAVLAWRGEPTDTLLDVLARRIHDMGLGDAGWNQLLLLEGGKLIIGFGPRAGGPEHGVVLVGTRDPLAIARREVEREEIVRLRGALPPGLAALVPAALSRFEVGGLTCFVIERKPGVTIDADVPQLERATREANEFLVALAGASRRSQVLDEDGFEARLERIFRQAERRNPCIAAEVGELRRAARDALLGREWVSVILHGDYKIENVIVDPATGRLNGVIDWEHTMHEGLPYLDLAYLMAYNRQVQGEDWISAAHALLHPQRLRPGEVELERRYAEALGLPPHLANILRALAPLHHVGCRRHGSWRPDEEVRLRALMRDCVQVVRGEVRRA